MGNLDTWVSFNYVFFRPIFNLSQLSAKSNSNIERPHNLSILTNNVFFDFEKTIMNEQLNYIYLKKNDL